MDIETIFWKVDDVLIQSLQVGEPAQRAESLFVLTLNPYLKHIYYRINNHLRERKVNIENQK